MTVGIILNIYGQVFYTKQGGKKNAFTCIFEEPGTNNLLISCSNYTYNSSANYANASTSILKVNSSGIMTDSINIPGNIIVAGKILSYNSDYYIYGIEYSSTVANNRISYPTLIKYDQQFNLIKKIKIDSLQNVVTPTYQNSVVINNKLYIAFYENLTLASKARIYKMSLNLDIESQTSFNSANLQSMIKLGDYLLVAGNGFPNQSLLGRPQVAKLDTNFNVISRFNLDSITKSPTNCSAKIGISDYTNLMEISPNTYYVGGFFPVPYSSCTDDDQAVYGIINNNNQVIEGKQYGVTGGIREAGQNNASMIDKKDVYIYNTCVSGLTNGIIMGITYTPTSVLTTKIDTSGNLIWQKHFNTLNYYYEPLAVCATSDSGVVVSGMRFNTLFPNQKDSMEGFVLKYDKNGNLSGGSTNVHEQTLLLIHVELFPNPTSNETSVNISLANSSDVAVTVLNNVGQIVYQSASTLSAGSNKVNIDTRNLASGIYNVLVATENGSVTKKLSVTK